MTELENILDQLNQNPLFQLSMGSKELFHSNFISWILSRDEEKYLFGEKFVLGVLNDIASLSGHGELLKCPSREKQNIDLQFEMRYFDNNEYKYYTFIIENKVKSLPYKEQLDQYSREQIKCCAQKKQPTIPVFILLSLHEFNSETLESWNYLSYQNLAEILLKHVNKIEVSQSNERLNKRSMVIEYIEFISLLQQFYSRIIQFESLEVYQEKIANLLRKFRLHDLTYKVKHEQIAHLVIEKIKSSSNYSYHKMSIAEMLNFGDYFIDSNFTNGTGITTMFFFASKIGKINKPLYLGIQLQGLQFRFFSMSESENHYDIALKLKESSVWFQMPNESILLKTMDTNLGKGRIKEKTDFAQYENGYFLYKYDKLDPSNSIENLVNAFHLIYQYLHTTFQNPLVSVL